MTMRRRSWTTASSDPEGLSAGVSHRDAVASRQDEIRCHNMVVYL